MREKKAQRADIKLISRKGLKVVLKFDKEYRAYKMDGKREIPMFLGGSDPTTLKKYIEENF